MEVKKLLPASIIGVKGLYFGEMLNYNNSFYQYMVEYWVQNHDMKQCENVHIK